MEGEQGAWLQGPSRAPTGSLCFGGVVWRGRSRGSSSWAPEAGEAGHRAGSRPPQVPGR